MHSYGADTSQSCLFMWEDLDPHPVRGSLGPPDSAPKQHLNQYIRFCTAHGRESYIYFTMDRHFPSKIGPFREASAPSSNTWFLGPATWHLNWFSRFCKAHTRDQ